MSYFDQTGLPFADYLQSGSPEALATLAAIASGLGYNQRIVGEVPTGAIDGQNATFTSANPFVPESLEVFVNGCKQSIVDDYQAIAPNQITLTFSPSVGEKISINYAIA